MNVAALLAGSATRIPDRDAWRYADRASSYAATQARVSRLAAGLRTHGLQRGDRVVLVLPNGPDLFELLWATLWAGLIAVPVNRHLHPREVGFVLAHSGARLLVVAAATQDAANTELAEAAVLNVDTQPYQELTTRAPMPMADAQPEDPAWLFYTSGTTGRPKGATLTHRNLMSMTLNYYADIDHVDDDAVYLHAAPLTHGSGLYLLPAVGHGAVNVISAAPRFHPRDYLALAHEHRATHGAFLAPTMLRRLADELSSGIAERPPLLRSITIGGAPLYEDDLRDALKAFGPIITQMYGQGESPMTISAMPPEQLPDDPDSPRWRSCGRPFTGVEVQVADIEGAEAPPGTPGEIWVRSDVVMDGYWADPAATADTLHDGWLRTGDIGHRDEHGFLYLTDRSKDVIISGGSNIYPREIEEVLLAHPAVREVAVLGLPDPEWGENVSAFVVPHAGSSITEAELIAHTLAHLASFKKPKTITFLEDLPKSANGKILKRELRDTGSGRSNRIER